MLDRFVDGVGVVGDQNPHPGDTRGLIGLIFLGSGGLVLAFGGEAALHPQIVMEYSL